MRRNESKETTFEMKTFVVVFCRQQWRDRNFRARDARQSGKLQFLLERGLPLLATFKAKILYFSA